jgi:DNA helicase-2/ATP-dependent DNA helicase PcrA
LAERVSDIEQMALEALDDTKRELLQDLIIACRQRIAEDATVNIADFLSWIDVASRFDGPPSKASLNSAVTVTTFHRAKGLEWPVVFLAGLEDGLVPFGNPSETQLNEERRLLYVAVTRAREELHCSFAAQRTGPKGTSRREPSPWLAAVADARIEDLGPSIAVVHRTIEEGRAALHATEAAVDPSRASIEKWRASRAQLTGIEPRLILADDVIDEIIKLRPSSRDELANVAGFGAIRAAAIGDELLALVAPRIPVE